MNFNNPFFIKNCAIATIATGDKANSLSELRDKLLTISHDSIYYHFWSRRLFSQFTHPEYPNDFSLWSHLSLHDEYLAERLSILDPTDYENLEDLRADLIDIIEQRLEEIPPVAWVQRGDPFHFIRSSLIVFETPYRIDTPFDLPQMIQNLSPNNIFYHFIDARSRTESRSDDFSTWLRQFGDDFLPLIEKIEAIDPYFLSLSDLNNELLSAVQEYFKTHQQGDKK
ncbi:MULTISPECIES: DUF5752 family protein [Parachlamydia]|jgi:hypothetical protein|uniref:Uncharacterized protein n=2 Tax=Parachlamydia acanthamoebae TaxID=83552 RepID=F8KYJ4_PARAV|nr:DUF5752 family protein [Parachlamydia acanthamoebae]EFB42367.1 hypothetical protein pah_c010o070 [Parachlamydia acanthamoebae str. Hall's coccus]KIA78352.1 hypothetical protein DB43_EF00340 [Parachlamydia acanthamoebae]CCB85947.1 putative uncharacterized protein [Parachlamydia acanthamoebae UV-7]